MDNTKPLDQELVNFDTKCERNKQNYYRVYPNTSGAYEKIFVTTEDRSKFFDITNKTKAEIQKSVLVLDIIQVCISPYILI